MKYVRGSCNTTVGLNRWEMYSRESLIPVRIHVPFYFDHQYRTLVSLRRAYLITVARNCSEREEARVGRGDVCQRSSGVNNVGQPRSRGPLDNTFRMSVALVAEVNGALKRRDRC